MKKFLIIALLIALLTPAPAAIVDPYDMLRGKQMVRDQGAPWFSDDAMMYFGTGKDASLTYNATSGYLEMVGLTAYDNTSLTVTSGEDITFAGGDSKMDLSGGSGVTKTTTGVNTFGGHMLGSANKNLYILGTSALNATTVTTLVASSASYLNATHATTVVASGSSYLNGTTIDTGDTLAVTTADKLTVGSVIVPQEMVINIPISTSDIDRSIFIADDAWQITKIEEAHTVAQNTAYPNTGSVSITKCTGTTAPGSGTAMYNATSYLNGSANTVVTPTLTGNTPDLTLADGNRLALNFNGTMTTFAGGVVTIHMKRV